MWKHVESGILSRSVRKEKHPEEKHEKYGSSFLLRTRLPLGDNLSLTEGPLQPPWPTSTLVLGVHCCTFASCKWITESYDLPHVCPPCRTFGPVQNIHRDTWSMPNGPWYLALSKTPVHRNCPRLQIAHKVYLYFWSVGLRHQKYYRVLLIQ